MAKAVMRRGRRIVVVLDSSALIPDYMLRSLSLEGLSGIAPRLKMQLAIPEVVVGELIRNLRKDLRGFAEKMTAGETKYRKAFPQTSLPRIPPDVVDADIENYERELHVRLDDLGIEIIPLPDVDHREILDRDLEAKKPFTESGKGYRDALIWESLKKLPKARTDAVIFVSRNTNDFCDSDGSFSSVLRAEWDLIQTAPFEFYDSIESLLATKIRPFIDEINQFEQTFKDIRGLPFDNDRVTLTAIEETVADFATHEIKTNPFLWESHGWDDINAVLRPDLSTVKQRSVLRLLDGDYLLGFRVPLRLQLPVVLDVEHRDASYPPEVLEGISDVDATAEYSVQIDAHAKTIRRWTVDRVVVRSVSEARDKRTHSDFDIWADTAE